MTAIQRRRRRRPPQPSGEVIPFKPRRSNVKVLRAEKAELIILPVIRIVR